MFYLCSRLRPQDAKDGTSTTFNLGEVGEAAPSFCGSPSGEGSAWMSTIVGLRFPNESGDSTSHFWSFHPGGTHFSFVDGHVDFLNYSMDRGTFWALATRAGGEVPVEF